MAKAHQCRWRTEAAKLEAELADKDARLKAITERLNKIEHKLGLAERQIIGPKSERMPTPDEEARKKSGEDKPRGGNVNPAKRKKNAEAMAKLPSTIVQHAVPDAERRCPHCNGAIKSIGEGDQSLEYEWVPGHVERRVHIVEVGRCPCKQHYARGPAPVRVQEGCTYGPAFLAKLAVDKCADATPIYRIEKQMRRSGIPISRSTMNDLVLLAGEVCFPIWECLVKEVRLDAHLQADETSFRTQNRRERSFVWTFLSAEMTAYIYSPTRSGDTPKALLEGTTGSLTVDGFTGYNHITDVGGRDRTGCWSHARRYLFDALSSAPEAREGLDIILELFMLEREAANAGISGTAAHLALRKQQSAPVLARLDLWHKQKALDFEPSSAMGVALRYMRNQWPRLTVFLRDAQIPIHNNASESALRIIALARKNFMFFGNENAARKFMVLYSLIATCEKHDINPEVYLTDVLIRIQDQPKSRIAELLPHRWKKSFGSGFEIDSPAIPVDAI